MAIYLLLKARKGSKKAGSKYYKRVPRAGGGYRYFYNKNAYDRHVSKAKSGSKIIPVIRIKKKKKVAAKESGGKSASNIRPVRLGDIRAVKQMREKFDKEAISELAASIQKDGLLQPVVVKEDPENNGKYIIVAGERRMRAMKILEQQGKLPENGGFIQDGKVQVSVIVGDQKTLRRVQFIENTVREDMTNMETAKAIKAMVDEDGVSFAQIARDSGKSAKYVSNHYKLNDLDPKVVRLFESKGINQRQALRLADMDAPDQLKWSREIVEGNWTATRFDRELRVHDAKKQEQAFFSPEEGMTSEQLSAHDKLSDIDKDPDKLRTKFQQFYEKQVSFINSFLDNDGVNLSTLGLAATGHMEISMSKLELLQHSITDIMRKMKQKQYELNAPDMFKSSSEMRIKREKAYRNLMKTFAVLKKLKKLKEMEI